MQTTSCTWPYVVPIGEDPAAHGHWCAFTDLYHTIPYTHSRQPSALGKWYGMEDVYDGYLAAEASRSSFG